MNLKKLLCLLLALVMVLSLAACDSSDGRNDDDEEEEEDAVLSEAIVGTWACSLKFDTNTTPGMEAVAEMGVNMQFEVPVLITFTDDGEVSMEMDESKAEETAAKINEIYTDALMDYLQLMADENGMSLDDLEESFVQENGMTLREYAASVAEEIDLYGTMADEMDIQGEYEVDDDEMTLDIDGDVVNVELKGSTLTLVSAEDEDVWAEAGITFPTKLKKVD